MKAHNIVCEPLHLLLLQWTEAGRTVWRTADNRHSPASGDTFWGCTQQSASGR